MEIRGGLIGVDEGKQFDIWVAHLSRTIEIAKVVDGVDSTKKIVAQQPVARREVCSATLKAIVINQE